MQNDNLTPEEVAEYMAEYDLDYSFLMELQ